MMRRLLAALVLLLACSLASAQLNERHAAVVMRLQGAVLAPATSYRVTVYERGAVASGASSDGTIEVYAGHGVEAGDRLLLEPGGANTLTATVDSVTATTIVFSPETYSTTKGMLLVNMGSDTGMASPNFDGSGETIYTYPGETAVSNSTVTVNSLGNYSYWYIGNYERWELIRTSGGSIVEVRLLYGGSNDTLDVTDFGAVCDGTTDDSSEIQAAIDTANTLGGGWVELPKHSVCAIGTGLTLYRYVGLRGNKSMLLGTAAITMISIVDAANVSPLNGSLPLGFEGLIIDGGDVATTGIYVDELDGCPGRDTEVRRIDGVGVVWDRTQNTGWDEVRVFNSDHGFYAVNAAGNVTCRGCETSNIDGHHIFVGDDATRANYEVGQNESFSIKFVDSQFERQTNDLANTEMVELDRSLRFLCDGCGFVMVDDADASTTTRLIHVDSGAVDSRFRHCGFNINQVNDARNGQIAVDNDGVGTLLYYPRFVGFDGSGLSSVNNVVRSDARMRVEYPTDFETYCTTMTTCDPGTPDLQWAEYGAYRNPVYGTLEQHGDFELHAHGAGTMPIMTLNSSDNGGNVLFMKHSDDLINEERSPLITFRNGGAAQATEDVSISNSSSGNFEVLNDSNALGLRVTQLGAVLPGSFFRMPSTTTLTIATGAVTATQAYHLLAGEGGVSDTLDTINGGTAGDILILRTSDSAQDITISEAGNIKHTGTCALTHVDDVAVFLSDGTNWLAIICSDNTA